MRIDYLRKITHAPAGYHMTDKSDPKAASSNKSHGDCRYALTAAKLARIGDWESPALNTESGGPVCVLCTVVCTLCTSIPMLAPMGGALINIDAMRDSGWR